MKGKVIVSYSTQRSKAEAKSPTTPFIPPPSLISTDFQNWTHDLYIDGCFLALHVMIHTTTKKSNRRWLRLVTSDPEKTNKLFRLNGQACNLWLYMVQKLRMLV